MTPQFQVDLSEQMKRRLLKIQHEARALGIPKKYLQSLKKIVGDLSVRADSLGSELVRVDAGTRMLFRIVRMMPLEVEYAVHLESRIVWIKEVRLISEAN